MVSEWAAKWMCFIGVGALYAFSAETAYFFYQWHRDFGERQWFNLFFSIICFLLGTLFAGIVVSKLRDEALRRKP